MSAENGWNHDKRGWVIDRLVQLEKECRKTKTREEEEVEKREQRGENLLNSFLKLLKIVRYEPNILFTYSWALESKGRRKTMRDWLGFYISY